MGQFPKDIAKGSILIIVLEKGGCRTIVVTQGFESTFIHGFRPDIKTFCF